MPLTSMKVWDWCLAELCNKATLSLKIYIMLLLKPSFIAGQPDFNGWPFEVEFTGESDVLITSIIKSLSL
jgi:hypothetical protein